jgi:alkylhydroperoxidase family enzyme
VFTTLARHRRLFRRWLRFAGALMPGGRLPRADSELLILRVAVNCSSDYEWRHHERLGRAAGLSREQIAAIRSGGDGLSDRQQLLLRVADELHADRDLSDTTFGELRALLSEAEVIEVCLLVGHYEMLAMTLNALRVQPDPPPGGRAGRVAFALQRAVSRRDA